MEPGDLVALRYDMRNVRFGRMFIGHPRRDGVTPFDYFDLERVAVGIIILDCCVSGFPAVLKHDVCILIGSVLVIVSKQHLMMLGKARDALE